MVKAHEFMWHRFIEQYDEPTKEIMRDFDGTDIPVHGEQPGKFFNRYYDHHCYFPLYVFCGRHLLVSYLVQSPQRQPPQLGHPSVTGAVYPSVLADTRIVLR